MAGLKMITGPAAEPVTLAEVKSHLRIDSTTEDTYLGTLIQTAREFCENFQNRAYITQTWELTFDRWPWFPVEISLPNLISVTSIKYFDVANVEYTLDTADYFVDVDSSPGRIGLGYLILLPTTVLRPTNAIKILFVAGYGAAAVVPLRIKQAILLLVGHYYENRETVSPVELREVPLGVKSLLWLDRVVPI